MIHGGCGADGGVLNDVWAFSIERERWTLLSGESTTTDGEPDRREFGRGSAGVPKSATWIDAPGRCAHGCVYVAGALRLFGGIASRAPASVHESVNVYLSATAAEHARDRGAVFSSVGKLRETAETPATSPPDPPPAADPARAPAAGLWPASTRPQPIPSTRRWT